MFTVSAYYEYKWNDSKDYKSRTGSIFIYTSYKNNFNNNTVVHLCPNFKSKLKQPQAKIGTISPLYTDFTTFTNTEEKAGLAKIKIMARPNW